MTRANKAVVQQASPDFSEFAFLNLTCGKFLNFISKHRAQITVSAALSGGLLHSNKAGTTVGSLY
jgi:hypothetical protein